MYSLKLCFWKLTVLKYYEAYLEGLSETAYHEFTGIMQRKVYYYAFCFVSKVNRSWLRLAPRGKKKFYKSTKPQTKTFSLRAAIVFSVLLKTSRPAVFLKAPNGDSRVSSRSQSEPNCKHNCPSLRLETNVCLRFVFRGTQVMGKGSMDGWTLIPT